MPGVPAPTHYRELASACGLDSSGASSGSRRSPCAWRACRTQARHAPSAPARQASAKTSSVRRRFPHQGAPSDMPALLGRASPAEDQRGRLGEQRGRGVDRQSVPAEKYMKGEELSVAYHRGVRHSASGPCPGPPRGPARPPTCRRPVRFSGAWDPPVAPGALQPASDQ